MAHPPRSLLDAPSEQKEGAPRAPSVPLRLTVTRGQLGLELYQPLSAGPVSLITLALALPNLAFPLDLSGGVSVFRHHRGLLQHMQLWLAAYDLERWLERAWRGSLGGELHKPTVWLRQRGVQIGALGAAQAIAFEVLWAPDGRDARLVVANARAAGKLGVSLARALQLLEHALSGIATRRGRTFTIADLGGVIGRHVLPNVGARAPDSTEVRLSALTADADAVSLWIDSTLSPPSLADETLRAVELATLVCDADDALVSGELDAARRLYLAALTRAPRHPEIVKLIAEIDCVVGERDAAALGLIVETLPATSAGWVGAELLFKAGDLDAARAALQFAVRGEPYAPLAALWCLRLAEIEHEARLKLDALNQAVACAPSLEEARFARLTARASSGDVEGVLADAQHLEAAAKGSRARHVVLKRAAELLLRQGYIRDAGRLYERALRYVPDDPDSTAGLGRSLIEVGDFKRAVVLLERAIVLGDRQGEPQSDALIDLARVLAEEIGDLPQAIARVREVTGSALRAAEARALEAGWRARLGDIVGASLAYARSRQELELFPPPAHLQLAAEWLERAADFERDVKHDLLSAERHLSVALRLVPHDTRIQAAYRAVAVRLVEPDHAQLSPASEVESGSAALRLPSKD